MNTEQAKLINYLQKRDYVTQKELANHLETTKRHVRDIIESVNHMFYDGNFDFMIIGNYAGCKLTNNIDLIAQYNNKRLATACSLIENAEACRDRVKGMMENGTKAYD